jgi:glycosyltransferase involved in cell wall biosynthesis
MRVAWFSPLPPVRSGIATYSAELIPRLSAAHAVDVFDPSIAHDFVWKDRRHPYDLVVYQLGNAPCHDYMWAYLAAYPGLVVLHDARLHQARARHLLNQRRFDDYRREFAYDHPDAGADFAEYAVNGLGGPIYYFWSMLRVVMRTARTIVVHNPRVADDLRQEYPDVAIEAIRMGVPAIGADRDAGLRVRRALAIPDDAVVFGAFGKVTPEKRIHTILAALATLRRAGMNVWLLVVGEADDDPSARAADGVRAAGYVADGAIGDYLSAADACLCLRWPTALETSASWLRCLAAARATVITDLPHLVDIPSEVTLRVDLLDEERGVLEAMRRLASDPQLREDLGRAGRAYWAAAHSLELMAADYERVLAQAASRPAPVVADLPAHFTSDYSEQAREMTRAFDVDVDILRAGWPGAG